MNRSLVASITGILLAFSPFDVAPTRTLKTLANNTFSPPLRDARFAVAADLHDHSADQHLRL